MILEISLLLGAGIVILAFFAEYIDSTLGMGYGTTLAPLLLLMGFAPLQVVPAILLAELITGFFAAFMHQIHGNVSFDFRKNSTSIESKISLVLGSLSVVGTIIAVVIAINLPSFYMKLYIGVLVSIMGLLILFYHNRKKSFSWSKIIGLGLIASFNKGISGGGYGPIVTSGQILSGVKTKASIAITSLSEGLTCLVGIISYFILGTYIDWNLAPFLVAGGILSVPFSAISVKKLKTEKLTLIIGIITIALGLFTLIKLVI